MLPNNRIIKQIAAIFAIVFPSLCFAQPEQIVSTTLCELVSNPEAFNHKLIKVSGDVTHGYRLFTLTGACKPNLSSVWLSYGGFINPPSIYNSQHVDQKRPQQLTIEGLQTTLVEDTLFKKFDEMVTDFSDRPEVTTTLIGRYFAGHQEQVGEYKLWKGFGPMDCCTLFVIQQVVTVKSKTHK